MEHGPLVGNPLPHFETQDEEGKLRTPQNLMGKNGLLLVFVYGTWCAPCVQTIYSVGRTAQAYLNEGVNVAIVAVDDAPTLKNFKLTSPTPINYPLLADPEEELHKLYDSAIAKTYLIVDPEGIVRAKFVNADGKSKPSHQALMGAVEEHLLGQIAQ